MLTGPRLPGMQQIELFPVPNPCRGICQSNAKGYCMGCFRSRTERFNWNDMMPAEKMRVIEVCELRRQKVEAMLAAKRQATQPASADQPPADTVDNS